MLFAPSLVLSTPSEILDRSRLAYVRLHRFRVHIELEATIAGTKQQTTYDVATDGTTLLLRMRQPPHAGMDRSDRIFAIGTDRLIAYDFLANERLTRRLKSSDSLLAKTTDVLGRPDDMLANLIDTSGMRAFLASMQAFKDWRTHNEHGKIDVVRQVGSGRTVNRTVLRFNGDSFLLSAIDVVSPAGEVHWRFEFSGPASTRFTPPASARLVTAFTVAQAPPNYRSAEARRITDRMIAANRALDQGSIIVRDDEGERRILVSGRRLREDQARFVYSFDGKQLTIFDRQKSVIYQGGAVRSTVPDLVAAVGGRVDVLSRQLFERRTPFQEVLQPGLVVAVHGRALSHGSPCDILEMTQRGVRMSFFVRRDNHLVDSVTTDSMDAQGHVLATSTRRFAYSGLGQALPDKAFHLAIRRSTRILPLPKEIRLAPGSSSAIR